MVREWLRDNPSAILTPEGLELNNFVKKTLGDTGGKRIDPETEILKYNLNEFNEFREKVSKILDSTRLDLPKWLMKLNRASCQVRYGATADTRMDAAKRFEEGMWAAFKAKENVDKILRGIG